MKIVEVNDVMKSYNEHIALSPVSFTVSKGERIALIGPSGAGKTTLLNLLSSTISASSGTIMVGTKNIHDYKGKQYAKKVGMIRQQFDLVGELAVIHNVLAGKLSDWGLLKSLISLLIPQDKTQALEALKRVGLEQKAFEKTSSLSGGEQQRVALARLLLQNPELILADEPVASLDPARAEDILSILTSLVLEENQTLIASLHSVEYALRYFTRIMALKSGKLIFDLPVSEITDDLIDSLYQLKEPDQQ